MIDILKRIKLGHGKPLTGTRWTLTTSALPVKFGFGDLTYSELIYFIRRRMTKLNPGESTTIIIKREEH